MVPPTSNTSTRIYLLFLAGLLLRAITCGKRSYVFQSRARGTTLEAMWPDLSSTDKLSVKAQLSVIFRAPRAGPAVSPREDDGGAAEAPATTLALRQLVSSICKDTRRVQRVSSALIDNEAAFNGFLVQALPRRTIPATFGCCDPQCEMTILSS